MNTTSDYARKDKRCSFESLESRTLFSWGTVDDLSGAAIRGIAADDAGNLYLAYQASDSANVSHAVVAERFSGSTTWTTLLDVPDSPATQVGEAQFTGIAVRAAGGGTYDLYVAGIGLGPSGDAGGPGAFVLEKHAGQSAFDFVDWLPRGDYWVGQLAADPTGNVYVVGSVLQDSTRGPIKTHNHWIVRKQTNGSGAFNTVDLMAEDDTRAFAVTTAGSSTIYVAGYGNGTGSVRRSTDGGATWTQVDTWNNSDAGGPSAPGPRAIAADGSGNVYAAGSWSVRTITGGTAKKPTYTWTTQWLVRRSTNGGVTWLNSDTYQLSSLQSSMGSGIVIDPLTGIAYVAGYANDASGVSHGIIRNNNGPGGTWQTVDNVQAPGLNSSRVFCAADSGGNLYVGEYVKDSGITHAIIRAQLASSASAPTSPFSSSPISGSSSNTTDYLMELLV